VTTPAAAHTDSRSPEAAITPFLASLPKPARLLVAVSGGSDSTGLLVALRNSILSAGNFCCIELLAVTVDHALRPQSAGEAEAVARLCQQLAIPHFIRRWEGEKPVTGLSAAARAARYGLLCEVADAVGATAILTGHTLDDQIETLVMRKARVADEGGALADDAAPDLNALSAENLSNLGLAGMAPAVLVERRHWLLRPFLNVRRAEIRALLQAAGIGWIDDPSNVDPRSERARTRRFLADRPEAGAALIQAAADVGAERVRLGKAAAELFTRHLTIERGVLARLEAQAFSAEPAVLAYALASLTAVLGGRAHLPGRESLRRIVAFVGEGAPGRLTVGRVLFQRQKNALFMARESRDLPESPLGHAQDMLWDGRFRVQSPAGYCGPMKPGAADRMAAQALFPQAPPALSLAAFRSLPNPDDGVEPPDGALIEPVLQPYHAFLPVFDVDIANSLAALMGLRAFAALPFNVFDRKR
jgi:tRNA(Ile)-lysidine synthase